MEENKDSHKSKNNSNNFWKFASLALLVIVVILVFKNFNDPSLEVQKETTKEIIELNKVLSDNDPFIGDENAPITIVEFSDYQCPFCARFHSQTLPQLKKAYIETGIVKFVYRDYPLNNIHSEAQKAAEAGECANEQGKFWEYHDTLFTNQGALKINNLKQYAKNLNLDTAKFNECLDSGKYTNEVQNDLAAGSANGISGTPGFLINGELVSGAQPFENFQRIIEGQLTGKAQAPSSATPPPVEPTVDTSKDPKIELIVINDKTCDVCVTDQLIDVLTTQLFPTAKVKELDYKKDAEGRKLVENLNIIALPAYIFSSNVKDAANFNKVKEALNSYGKYYVIDASTTDAPKLLIEINEDDDPFIGDKNAPITIIEFSDFQCPFCRKFWSETLPQLKKEYINTGKVKLVYRDFPLNMHPNAQKAAEAGECADDQGKFWEMHDMIFNNQKSMKVDDLKSYADEIGLDTNKFNDCLDSGKYESEVQKDLQEGQTYGISGTPGFFIEGVKVSGAYPFEYFQEIIDGMLVE